MIWRTTCIWVYIITTIGIINDKVGEWPTSTIFANFSSMGMQYIPPTFPTDAIITANLPNKLPRVINHEYIMIAGIQIMKSVTPTPINHQDEVIKKTDRRKNGILNTIYNFLITHFNTRAFPNQFANSSRDSGLVVI